MPFKIALFYKLCQHILLENGDGAGVKAESFLEIPHHFFGQNHISDTHGGGYSSGKGVKVNHAAVSVQRKDRVLVLGGDGQLRVVVILDKNRLSFLAPGQIFHSFDAVAVTPLG